MAVSENEGTGMTKKSEEKQCRKCSLPLSPISPETHGVVERAQAVYAQVTLVPSAWLF